MLIRILIAMRDDLAVRVLDAVKDEDAVVERVREHDDLWSDLGGRTFDMLIASRDAIPRPIADAVDTVAALPGHPEVVVLMDVESIEDQTRLLGAGCAAALNTGSTDDALASAFGALIARRREEGVLRIQTETVETDPSLSDFRSESPIMQQLLAVAQRVASSDTTALILGETGAGKEWLARGIHTLSSRADSPFIAVNCGAIPESLIESELFGHEEGAFTGARRAHRGYFEMAHMGTIFLDEVAEMPSHVQVRLLRVVQERQFQRVGSEKPISVDIRILAATNRDPLEEIAAKRLRSDLYYRLGVVTLALPALRDRKEDIEALTRHFLAVNSVRIGRHIEGISRRAMAALETYEWPGNIRELQNVIERLTLLADGTEIDIDDLPDDLMSSGRRRNSTGQDSVDEMAHRATEMLALPLLDARRRIINAFERGYLEAMLQECGGRVGITAARAGISERALYSKMRRYGLDKERFR